MAKRTPAPSALSPQAHPAGTRLLVQLDGQGVCEFEVGEYAPSGRFVRDTGLGRAWAKWMAVADVRVVEVLPARPATIADGWTRLTNGGGAVTL